MRANRIEQGQRPIAADNPIAQGIRAGDGERVADIANTRAARRSDYSYLVSVGLYYFLVSMIFLVAGYQLTRGGVEINGKADFGRQWLTVTA